MNLTKNGGFSDAPLVHNSRFAGARFCNYSRGAFVLQLPAKRDQKLGCCQPGFAKANSRENRKRRYGRKETGATKGALQTWETSRRLRTTDLLFSNHRLLGKSARKLPGNPRRAIPQTCATQEALHGG